MSSNGAPKSSFQIFQGRAILTLMRVIAIFDVLTISFERGITATLGNAASQGNENVGKVRASLIDLR